METFKKERNDKTVTLRGYNDRCSAIQSQINKDLETLQLYADYKSFLDGLRPKEEQEKAAKIKATKRAMRDIERQE